MSDFSDSPRVRSIGHCLSGSSDIRTVRILGQREAEPPEPSAVPRARRGLQQPGEQSPTHEAQGRAIPHCRESSRLCNADAKSSLDAKDECWHRLAAWAPRHCS